MRCPNCQRVYTGLGKKESPAELYVRATECPQCFDFNSTRTPVPSLEPYLVTPTYVKVFNNPHIQTIWHNAYVELAEASEIIFLGYSMPESDYHFRTLLRRAINRKAAITVVLTEKSDPAKLLDQSFLYTLASDRYRRFFESQPPAFKYYGIQGFFEGKFNPRNIQ